MASGGALDAALDQPAQHEGGVAGGAAARVVGLVGDHDGAAPLGEDGQGAVERGVERQRPDADLAAQARGSGGPKTPRSPRRGRGRRR
jgi:hypothetical protein